MGNQIEFYKNKHQEKSIFLVCNHMSFKTVQTCNSKAEIQACEKIYLEARSKCKSISRMLDQRILYSLFCSEKLR